MLSYSSHIVFSGTCCIDVVEKNYLVISEIFEVAYVEQALDYVS